MTGHENGVFEQPPAELWRLYGAVIAEREKRLLDLLETPRTLKEILEARIIYKRPREPKVFFAFGERVLMKKHLEHLIRRDIVILEDERYRQNEVRLSAPRAGISDTEDSG